MDFMDDAFDSFWATEKKKKPMAIKKNAFGYDEDEAYQSFWNRSRPAPVYKSYDASQGSKYVKNVQPVKYNPSVVAAKTNVALLQQEIQRKQLEDKLAEINEQRFNKNVQTVKKAINIAKPIAKKTVSRASLAGRQIANKAKQLYKQFSTKKLKDPSVGLGGQIYDAKKELGQSSIYD